MPDVSRETPQGSGNPTAGEFSRSERGLRYENELDARIAALPEERRLAFIKGEARRVERVHSEWVINPDLWPNMDAWDWFLISAAVHKRLAALRGR